MFHVFLKGPPESSKILDHLSNHPDLGEYGKTPYVSQLLDLGAIYVNQSRVESPTLDVGPADTLRVHFKPKRYDLSKVNFRDRVVFENDNFMILNKPSKIPLHPTVDNQIENVLGYFKGHFITHRLDLPTSGLVCLAKTKSYQAIFNKLLSERKVEKRYLALHENPIPLGLHTHYMIDSPRKPKVLLNEVDPKFKTQICTLKVLKSEKRIFNRDQIEFQTALGSGEQVGFLSSIELLTGRTHQIRAQLSHMKSPIVGDEDYRGMKAGFFGLLANRLSFTCPVDNRDYVFSAKNT